MITWVPNGGNVTGKIGSQRLATIRHDPFAGKWEGSTVFGVGWTQYRDLDFAKAQLSKEVEAAVSAMGFVRN